MKRLTIGICGANGAVGKVLLEEIKKDETLEYAGAIYWDSQKSAYHNNFSAPPEVIIDFSRPEALDYLLDYGITHGCPIALCTTGYSQEQLEQIQKAGDKIPLLLSSNTALGINILRKVLQLITPMLQQYNVEIIETHHSHKIDAPSGTSKTLKQEIINQSNLEDVLIHSLRLGGISGEHRILFANEGEVIELKHTALSKTVFALGAIVLAKKLIKLPNGFYDTMDLLE